MSKICHTESMTVYVKDLPVQIDEEDMRLFCSTRWSINHSGHIRSTGIKAEFLHRVIMQPPADMVVDHRDGDKLNNRRDNLRICTQKQNAINIRQPRGKSGFIGVTSYSGDEFVASIKTNSGRVNIGIYQTAIDAAVVRDSAAKYYNGEFAVLNFPSRDIPAHSVEDLRSGCVDTMPRQATGRYGGYSGVSARLNGKWMAFIYYKGRQNHLGHYDTAEAAAIAHDRAAVHFFGHGARRNFPNINPAPASPIALRRESGFRRDHSTQYRGVHFEQMTRKYRARIRVNGDVMDLGRFVDPEDAARAYDAAAKEHNGDRAILNFT